MADSTTGTPAPVTTGAIFGRLTVIAITGRGNCMCRCSCGIEKSFKLGNLKNGHTKSCGCLRTELAGSHSLKHGMSRRGKNTRTFRIWAGMRDRCRNSNTPIFSYYGSRGIRVCERWDTFTNFLADMGECPAGKEIDRINNDGNYEPENCRWVTRSENCRNHRRNVRITMKGETKTLIEWTEQLGLVYAAIKARIQHGWDPERALTTPKMRNQFR